jgi:hypothetical protein
MQVVEAVPAAIVDHARADFGETTFTDSQGKVQPMFRILRPTSGVC